MAKRQRAQADCEGCPPGHEARRFRAEGRTEALGREALNRWEPLTSVSDTASGALEGLRRAVLQVIELAMLPDDRGLAVTP